jgi:hypothetical protein
MASVAETKPAAKRALRSLSFMLDFFILGIGLMFLREVYFSKLQQTKFMKSLFFDINQYDLCKDDLSFFLHFYYIS